MARAPAFARTSRGTRRSLPARLLMGLGKISLGFVILSLLWVALYRFLNPPITATMTADLLAGRGAARDWMSLEQLDRDMVRAVIAAEDSKFCRHDGFDLQAIEDAFKSNLSGGRIRGGSTISQQTAKNAFLWQGGGYLRKGLEAWFTLLIEQIWGKRRIMEVYLNIAETGIGTYGVNAGARRYYGHDASTLTREQAARIAAILPLPKGRDAIAPRGFTRRYGNTIAARLRVVARDRLDGCVYQGAAVPPDRNPPRVPRQPRELPGAVVETTTPPPPPPPEVLDALPEALPEEAPAVPEPEPGPEPAPEPGTSEPPPTPEPAPADQEEGDVNGV